ncbi:acyl-CoA carboxylase subunit epsilon [Streptomyces sp. TBY4]|uniref:acyl-CoA carboxylase subunit epsilon n=1 Tax=Streptomyces sp. TBY4 TaxID=2962030 RepID=UPI0020B7A620|nr:acyl-CoA carboxylase subunit epsilon [Streptomyces sp. TBY4]MCP3760579.1 acyl-CoA carboxylase subunit epsilon [Streptomyces sp. TBY4]
MERLTDAEAPELVRVVRGTPNPQEMAALMAVLVTTFGAAGADDGRTARPAARPTWSPFTAHGRGGWGQL